MRFKRPFSAVLQLQRTVGSRKDIAMTAKESCWPHSKCKPFAIFRKTTTAFRRQK